MSSAQISIMNVYNYDDDKMHTPHLQTCINMAFET